MEYVGNIKSKQGFYIGDICYVLSDDTYDKIWGNKNNYRDGKIEVGDNFYLVHGTSCGDGCYEGTILGTNQKLCFGVDAGVIGIVPKELIDETKWEAANSLGVYIEGQKAILEYNEGTFYITIMDDKTSGNDITSRIIRLNIET